MRIPALRVGEAHTTCFLTIPSSYLYIERKRESIQSNKQAHRERARHGPYLESSSQTGTVNWKEETVTSYMWAAEFGSTTIL